MVAYRYVRPLLGLVSPETAHGMAIHALKSGALKNVSVSGVPVGDDPLLTTRVWNLSFSNPIGLAAGFDKDGEVMEPMLGFGFGFVEAGTVTPLPQPGNPKPRLFRLGEDRAVINRFGFNSKGLDHFAGNLRAHKARKIPGIVGANVGKNRDVEDAAADYVTGISRVCSLADYLVCNVSSPNTPGLRNLQARAEMESLIQRVLEARHRAVPASGKPPPLLAKVGPDLDDQQMRDIAEVALKTGIDGLIVGNTTVTRPAELRSRHAFEGGGLSGKPLLPLANKCLADMYRLTGGKIPIIGCGGVSDGVDAYEKIRAGASLVQLYSALVYEGPELVARIKQDLVECLRADGHVSVAAAVGADHRKQG